MSPSWSLVHAWMLSSQAILLNVDYDYYLHIKRVIKAMLGDFWFTRYNQHVIFQAYVKCKQLDGGGIRWESRG